MDWNLLKSLIKKCFIKWIIYPKWKTLYCVVDNRLFFFMFEWHVNCDKLAVKKKKKGGWCTKWSCKTEPPFNTSHEPCCHILTVLRLFVELWSPDVLRQHLCFHFQFHRFQRPIWRLSEAIVSLCMQIFQLFTPLLWGPYLHLVAIGVSQNLFRNANNFFHQND